MQDWQMVFVSTVSRVSIESTSVCLKKEKTCSSSYKGISRTVIDLIGGKIYTIGVVMKYSPRQ